MPRHVLLDGITEQLAPRLLRTSREPLCPFKHIVGNGNGGLHTFSITNSGCERRQILFEWDARKEPIEDAIAAFYDSLYSEQSETKPERDEFVDRLVKGVAENITEIDRRLAQHAEHWRIERMPAVDRNLLRLAIYEMMAMGTPPPVAIDEESVHFVNGVLDAAKREIESAAGQGQG